MSHNTKKTDKSIWFDFPLLFKFKNFASFQIVKQQISLTVTFLKNKQHGLNKVVTQLLQIIFHQKNVHFLNNSATKISKLTIDSKKSGRNYFRKVNFFNNSLFYFGFQMLLHL